MAEKKKPIAVQVEEKIGAVIGGMGYEIWDIFYGKEGQNLVLRITIDKEGGIGIQDCEAVSRAVDPLLDEIPALTDAYSFEVSSPGLGRKIRTDMQYARYVGEEITVHLIRADASGKRDHVGVLEAADGDEIRLRNEDGIAVFSKSDISYSKANDDKDLFRKG